MTPRQNDVLNFIKKHVLEYGYPPTLKEIGLSLGFSGHSRAAAIIHALIRDGYLIRGREARSIRVIDKPEAMNNLHTP